MSQRHPRRPSADLDRLTRYVPGMRPETPKRNVLIAITYALLLLVLSTYL